MHELHNNNADHRLESMLLTEFRIFNGNANVTFMDNKYNLQKVKSNWNSWVTSV